MTSGASFAAAGPGGYASTLPWLVFTKMAGVASGRRVASKLSRSGTTAWGAWADREESNGPVPAAAFVTKTDPTAAKTATIAMRGVTRALTEESSAATAAPGRSACQVSQFAQYLAQIIPHLSLHTPTSVLVRFS